MVQLVESTCRVKNCFRRRKFLLWLSRIGLLLKKGSWSTVWVFLEWDKEPSRLSISFHCSYLAVENVQADKTTSTL